MSNNWENKTVGGYPVRIYAEDGGYNYPIHGAIKTACGWQSTEWLISGQFNRTTNDARDLIPKKKRLLKTEIELLETVKKGYDITFCTSGHISVYKNARCVFFGIPEEQNLTELKEKNKEAFELLTIKE